MLSISVILLFWNFEHGSQIVMLCANFTNDQITENTEINRLMQEKRNSIANALELRLSCINPSRWKNNSSESLL